MSLNIERVYDNFIKEPYREDLNTWESPCTMVDGKMVCQKLRNNIGNLIEINNKIVDKRNKELDSMQKTIDSKIDKIKDIKTQVDSEKKNNSTVIDKISQQNTLSTKIMDDMKKKYNNNMENLYKINKNEINLINVRNKLMENEHKMKKKRGIVANNSVFKPLEYKSENICAGKGTFSEELNKCICNENRESDFFCEECIPGFDIDSDCQECLEKYDKIPYEIYESVDMYDSSDRDKKNVIYGITGVVNRYAKVERRWDDNPIKGRWIRIIITKYYGSNPGGRFEIITRQSNGRIQYISNNYNRHSSIGHGSYNNSHINNGRGWYGEAKDNQWVEINLGQIRDIIGVKIKPTNERNAPKGVLEFKVSVATINNTADYYFKEMEIKPDYKYKVKKWIKKTINICNENKCNLDNIFNYDSENTDNNVYKMRGTCNVEKYEKEYEKPIHKIGYHINWHNWKQGRHDNDWRLYGNRWGAAVWNRNFDSNIYEIHDFLKKYVITKLVILKHATWGDLTEFELYYADEDEITSKWRMYRPGLNNLNIIRANYKGMKDKIKWKKIMILKDGIFRIPHVNNHGTEEEKLVRYEIKIPGYIETRFFKIKPLNIGPMHKTLNYRYNIFGYNADEIPSVCSNKWKGINCDICNIKDSDPKSCSCFNDKFNGYWTEVFMDGGKTCPEGFVKDGDICKDRDLQSNQCALTGNKELERCTTNPSKCVCTQNDKEGYWTGEKCNKCKKGWWGVKCRNKVELMEIDDSKFKFIVNSRFTNKNSGYYATWEFPKNIHPSYTGNKITRLRRVKGQRYAFRDWQNMLKNDSTYIQVDLGNKYQILGLRIRGQWVYYNSEQNEMMAFKILISDFEDFKLSTFVKPDDKKYTLRNDRWPSYELVPNNHRPYVFNGTHCRNCRSTQRWESNTENGQKDVWFETPEHARYIRLIPIIDHDRRGYINFGIYTGGIVINT